MKKYNFLFLILFATTIQAQEITLTQNLSSPLIFNPALTGLINSNTRLSAHYRTQWNSYNATPNLSGVLSFDTRISISKRRQDFIGIGLLTNQNQFYQGEMKMFQGGLSLAYHKKIGTNPNKIHYLSLGVQGMYLRKQMDYSTQDRTTLPSFYANMRGASFTYSDFNTGLMYTGNLSKRINLYAGFASQHVTQPIETSINGTNRISRGNHFSVGGSYAFNQTLLVLAGLHYRQQGLSQYVQYNVFLNKTLNKEAKNKTQLYVGVYGSYAESIAPSIGIERGKIRCLLSYDIQAYGYSPITTGKAVELSLQYNGFLTFIKQPNSLFFVPQF